MAHRVLAIFRRRLLNTLTILSLLLCLATLALWARSYWRYDYLVHDSSDGEMTLSRTIGSNFGRLFIHDVQGSAYFNPPSQGHGWTHGATNVNHNANYTSSFFGFAYYYETQPSQHGWIRSIHVPLWFPALLLAILPALRLRSILRTRRRHRLGLCQRCGYDLRATPQGARCPECGRVQSSEVRDQRSEVRNKHGRPSAL